MDSLLVVLEYDGTDFCGFQRQQDGRTVQATVEAAIAELTGEAGSVVGAGRTDAGVHAWAQVIRFRTSSRIPVERWPAALNGVLPPDAAAVEARRVDEDFDPRKCARSKTYLYRIVNRQARSALERRYAHFCGATLDLEAMGRALAAVEGEHDFSAFARREKEDRRVPVRRVLRAECWREGEEVNLLLQANGFLYRMARSLAGTALEVGMGRRPPALMAALLRSGEREAAGSTAPPQGLFLAQVEYDCKHLQARFGRMFQ